MRLRSKVLTGCLLIIAGITAFAGYIREQVLPVPIGLPPIDESLQRASFLDRRGEILTTTYENRWNTSAEVALRDIPPFLVNAFLASEDGRYFQHGGTDWRGVASAIWDSARFFRLVRGGSSITEQSVRMVNTRPRTIISRLVEVVEARQLEAHFSKSQILEFYLNQVPFAARRRGVLQGAHLLFDRDLSTLSEKEMSALVVMVRAPAYFDPRKDPKRVEAAIENLLLRMQSRNLIDGVELERILSQKIQLRSSKNPLEASHFVRFVREETKLLRNDGPIRTTLDGTLQRRLQNIMKQRLGGLKDRGVHDGALLAVDNETGEILAWVNGSDFFSKNAGSQIDGVVSPRQPGSTLKPFLYAMAFDNGWSPASIVMDEPLARPVAAGIHRFRNYSGTYHGPVTVRDALGNSLNIPAVQAVQSLGTVPFLAKLRDLGFSSLDREPDFYGEGVALGAGEVTLYELVRAYMVLATGGKFRELTTIERQFPLQSKQVLSSTATSLIGDILSDAGARQLEFSDDSVLDFPIQTAVKTGTSTDYRDAWAVGFSSRYTVGVWMGNLGRTSMSDVTGSTGPALVLRSAFAELERRSEPRPLKVTAGLVRKKICRVTGLLPGESCPIREELFRSKQVPQAKCSGNHIQAAHKPHEDFMKGLAIRLPTSGMIAALDPRIPDELEAFPFEISESVSHSPVEWIVDGKSIGESRDEFSRMPWKPVRGKHVVQARRKRGDGFEISAPIGFLVK